MSLREVNKDHLSEHVSLEIVETWLPLPDHLDPLKFWTEHRTENFLVDLTVFATGETAKQQDKRHVGPFTGRQKLISQLAPAINAAVTSASKATVKSYLDALKAWWRLLDAVELDAARAGQIMSRVEDVRQLTEIYASYGRGDVGQNPMGRHTFSALKRFANATLKDLGAPELHWVAPEDAEPNRSLPSDMECAELRIRLKQEWYGVLRHFSLMDRMSTDGFRPITTDEEHLLAHWRHIHEVQTRTKKAVPSSEELRHGMSRQGFRLKTSLLLPTMRHVALPDSWQAEVAFHCCLMVTGWNPATLYSLDAGEAHTWLRDHPRLPERYLLVGTKARANDAEQPVEGLWKTRAGPGYIIRLWMERTALLREQLRMELAEERERYRQMTRTGASPGELTKQMRIVLNLEEGCRSVWLFAGEKGGIGWLAPRSNARYRADGENVTFLTTLLAKLNQERAAHQKNPIPHCTAGDFRDMFAAYVWRISGGNLFALMRALRHARIRTTQRYADNSLLNAERNDATRRFGNNLFSLLQKHGGFDLTLLTHLQRHGPVPEDAAQRLNDYRDLERSRIQVGCRDPFHPPPEIQTPGAAKVCRPQRCLLCKAHAVILPDSLDGVAMRVEELEYTKSVFPVVEWSDRLAEELANGLDVLQVFPPEQVKDARARWKKTIADGLHEIPGLRPLKNPREKP
ncbi:MAG: hypothetical protein H6R17_3079 [Proteobacteria bacterium]|nr:hypothetical protein [Pseudomonadota bacterium]